MTDHKKSEIPSIDFAVAQSRKRDLDGWTSLQQLSDWVVYTDGSAPFKNPGGAIGYSAVFLLDKDRAWELKGGVLGRTTDPATSNNRAEISGVLSVLKVVEASRAESSDNPVNVTVWCDSQYVVNCAVGRWKKHKNTDLWNRLDPLLLKLKRVGVKVAFQWTRAHVGTRWNERADILAKQGAEDVVGHSPATAEEKPQAASAPRNCSQPLIQVVSRMLKPGLARGVAIITFNGTMVRKETGTLSVQTLDEAEYRTVELALKVAEATLMDQGREPKKTELAVVSCRDLMLKQLRGDYQVKSANLQPLYFAALKASRNFGKVAWQLGQKSELQGLLETQTSVEVT